MRTAILQKGYPIVSKALEYPYHGTKSCMFGDAQKCDFAKYAKGIEKCRICGLGRTTSKVRSPEDQDYELTTDDAANFKNKYFQSVYRRCLRGIEVGWALDVGCGEGLFVDVLKQYGWRAKGIDSYFANNGGRNDIVTQDFLNFSTEKRFDLITFIHSFEHFSNPAAVLTKASSLLTHRGHILLVVPNFESSWSDRLKSDWPWLNCEDHHYHYTSRALENLVRKHDFAILGAKTYSSYTPSIMQVYLTTTGLFERKSTFLRPLKSVLFRTSGVFKQPFNWLVDELGRGAELQFLVKSKSVE